MSTFSLSDGTVLPKGTHVFIPSYHISHDPAIYENPDEFDGFRFEKMRKEKGLENRYQFVTIGYLLPEPPTAPNIFPSGIRPEANAFSTGRTP